MSTDRRACLRGLLVLAVSGWAGCGQRPAAQAVPRGAKVLALGDSLTHGTGAAPGQDWPTRLADVTGWQVVNAGVPGDTANAARTRLGPLLEAHRPALVIVTLGGNDFLRRRRPEAVRADLRDLVRQARATGAQVVLVAIPSPSLLGVLASRLSDDPLYADLARDEGVVGVADAVSAVLSDPALRADPIHPNAEGYRRLADRLHQQLSVAGVAPPG
ncbi:arylesterase [Aquabacterium sp. A08]|nr:arylesterase [Aquabacterium sp. A08]